MVRDYAALRRLELPREREGMLRALTDALWDALSPAGVSWIGFYFFERGCVPGVNGAPAQDGMILGARRDKPACSPIGMHGACGRAFLSGKSLVVTDVKRLGANYVACDPRDQSELVVPVCDERGERIGVLDADSFDVGAFTERDAREMAGVLRMYGLVRGEPANEVV